MDALDKLILKQWNGWVILSKHNTPIGISVNTKSKTYRTGFIEIFKTKKVAKEYMESGDKLIKVIVREEIN